VSRCYLVGICLLLEQELHDCRIIADDGNEQGSFPRRIFVIYIIAVVKGTYRRYMSLMNCSQEARCLVFCGMFQWRRYKDLRLEPL
jgi:hypothetical protein